MADELDFGESETTTKKSFDVSRFFTRKNEEEGSWVEPIVFGELFGLEFKVLGSNSTKLAMVIDEFRKKSSEIESLKDPEERAKRTAELYAASAAKRVVGLRAARGLNITVEGKPFEYSDSLIRHIFEESPEVASYIIRYSVDSSNFMTKKNA